MMGINEKDERRELLDAVADAGRLARGLDQLLESMARGDQLDPLDVEGILVLRSISERCAERIEDAARILEAAERGLLCRTLNAARRKRNAPLSAGKPSRCPPRLFDSGRRPELGRPWSA